MNKRYYKSKLPTSAEKPLTDRERLSIVRRHLVESNDEIIKLRDYADALEDKLLSIASDYLTEKEISDIENLIIDNFKQKFNK